MAGESQAPAEELLDEAVWKSRYPDALSAAWSDIEAAAKGKRIAVFSDYDGTLTPIVDQPDKAFMSEEMREAVRACARRFPIAIISGRSREKVQNFVQIEELYYAGSHGLDIAGPRSGADSAMVHQPAPWARELMNKIHDELVARIAGIEGASVEHNTYCVSVHYRLCVDRWPEVEATVDAIVAPYDNLHVTRGRKVFEVRPRVEWDKGRALMFLLEELGLTGAGPPGTFALYLGDDNSDEDAFRALASSGLGAGILVATRAKPTAAKYTLPGPEQVREFLLRVEQRF